MGIRETVESLREATLVEAKRDEGHWKYEIFFKDLKKKYSRAKYDGKQRIKVSDSNFFMFDVEFILGSNEYKIYLEINGKDAGRYFDDKDVFTVLEALAKFQKILSNKSG